MEVKSKRMRKTTKEDELSSSRSRSRVLVPLLLHAEYITTALCS
jgi:hypothetical protein